MNSRYIKVFVCMSFMHVGQAETEGEGTEQQDSSKSEPAPEVRKTI